jgi:hypothetical protein
MPGKTDPLYPVHMRLGGLTAGLNNLEKKKYFTPAWNQTTIPWSSSL